MHFWVPKPSEQDYAIASCIVCRQHDRIYHLQISIYIYLYIHSKVFQCYVLCVKRNFEGFGQMMGFAEVTARIPRRLLSICGRPGSKCSLSLFLHWCVKDEQNWSRNQKRFWCSFFCCFTKSLVTSRWKQMEGLFCHYISSVLPFERPLIIGALNWRGLRSLGVDDFWYQMAKHVVNGCKGPTCKAYQLTWVLWLPSLDSSKCKSSYETPLPQNKHVSTLSSGIMWIILASKFSSDVVNITSRGASLMSTSSPTTKVGFDHQRPDQGKLNASKAFLFET